MNSRRIITGAPGTGKTTLLRYLESQGADVVHEPARQILAEQKGLSWNAFTKLILERAIAGWQAAEFRPGTIIFDRGVPDSIAYARGFKLDEQPYWEAARQYTYHLQVYICPPWEAIYTTDAERTINFQQTVAFHESLVTIYEQLGYQLIELPLVPVAERARFFLKKSC
jgi:predicted ATPase